MSDLEDQISKLVAEAERRGAHRALRKVITMLEAMLDDALDDAVSAIVSDSLDRQASAKGRSERGTMGLVLEAITKQPGLKGVEVFRWLENRGTPVAERTVRTNLRRLRQDRVVWQRSKRWYPKTVDMPEGEDTADKLPF